MYRIEVKYRDYFQEIKDGISSEYVCLKWISMSGSHGDVYRVVRYNETIAQETVRLRWGGVMVGWIFEANSLYKDDQWQ